MATDMGEVGVEAREAVLERLAGQIQRIETGRDRASPFPTARVTTGWPEVDRTLEGGLARGRTHEWIAPEVNPGGRGASWVGPLCLLAHLAGRAHRGDPRDFVLWIGRRVWPYPRLLVGEWNVVHSPSGMAEGGGPLNPGRETVHWERGGDGDGRALLERSILVDVSDPARRLWAIDLALRSAAVGVVVADGSGLNMAASRRLQLAAAEGRALALFARPHHERSALSAAATRIGVCPALEDRGHPAWQVEVLRAKGQLCVDPGEVESAGLTSEATRETA